MQKCYQIELSDDTVVTVIAPDILEAVKKAQEIAQEKYVGVTSTSLEDLSPEVFGVYFVGAVSETKNEKSS